MKKVVMISTPDQLKIAATFCDHKNAILMYNEADGTNFYCPDCGAMLDENWDLVIVTDPDEIPY